MSSNVNRNFLESSKKFPLFHSMRCVTRGNFLRGWNFVGILNFFCKRSRFYLLILIVLLCSGTSSFMMSFPCIFLFKKSAPLPAPRLLCSPVPIHFILCVPTHARDLQVLHGRPGIGDLILQHPASQYPPSYYTVYSIQHTSSLYPPSYYSIHLANTGPHTTAYI